MAVTVILGTFQDPIALEIICNQANQLKLAYEKCHEYFDEVFSKEMFRSEELAIGVGYSCW